MAVAAFTPFLSPGPLPEPPPAIRHLDAADLPWANVLLAQATAVHPVLAYVGGEPAAALAWLPGQLLALALRHGGAYTNAERTALVLWLGPDAPRTLGWWELGGRLRAAWYLGRGVSARLGRLLRAEAWLRHQSLADMPHHRLLAVAVAPAARGRGVGRHLLAATLAARRQPRALPCYVSTQAPEQVAFLQSLGFRLTGHCALMGGPPGVALSTWGLLRPDQG